MHIIEYYWILIEQSLAVWHPNVNIENKMFTVFNIIMLLLYFVNIQYGIESELRQIMNN